jgi:hypothetical protein
MSIEWLESRTLLSGNVTITVQNNTLRIRGDGSDNAITIRQQTDDDGFNEFLVTARDGTTINGDDEEEDFDRAEIVSVFLKNGDDDVILNDLDLGGFLRVGTSNGNDSVTVNTADIGEHLYISTFDGSDDVDLNNVTVENRARVFLGADDDDLTINNGQFNADLIIRGKSGADAITLDGDTDTDGDKQVFGGPGVDDIEDDSLGG